MRRRSRFARKKRPKQKNAGANTVHLRCFEWTDEVTVIKIVYTGVFPLVYMDVSDQFPGCCLYTD